MTNAATLNLDELRAVRSELDRLAGARVKVGILGNKAERQDADWNKTELSNPVLGLWHEFGTKGGEVEAMEYTPEEVRVYKSAGLWARGMVKRKAFHTAPLPARSFLRMPLMTRLGDELEKIGRSVWRALVAKRGLLVALKDLGVLAENVVQRAFETGGFGQWKPLSKRTIARKGSSAILIDSAQLRKSVTSAVVERNPR